MKKQFYILLCLISLVLIGCVGSSKISVVREITNEEEFSSDQAEVAGAKKIDIYSGIELQDFNEERNRFFASCRGVYATFEEEGETGTFPNENGSVTKVYEAENELVIEINTKKVTPVEEEVKESVQDTNEHLQIVPMFPVTNHVYLINDFPHISQNPELPTGCEATALTIALRYYGYNADKMDIAENYLPKGPIVQNGNPYVNFVGDPKTANSYGCYAPVIVKCAENYGVKAEEITGTPFKNLLAYIENNTPVIIWATINMQPSGQDGWLNFINPKGELEYFKSREHCMVLCGYDIDSNIVYISDPLKDAVVSYDLNVVEQRYNEQGMNAVILK